MNFRSTRFSFGEVGLIRARNKVTCFYFSSDVKLLASAGHDKKVSGRVKHDNGKRLNGRSGLIESIGADVPILNTDIGGSSYDVSGNVIVKRRCIQQPDFRQETLGQIGSIEHQQRSTREVDSDPGNSISMPQISGDASYMEAASNMVRNSPIWVIIYSMPVLQVYAVHNPRLTDPTLQAVVSIGKRYRQNLTFMHTSRWKNQLSLSSLRDVSHDTMEFRKKFDGVGSLDQFMHIPTLKGEIVIPPRRKHAGKGRKK
ncbi:hypothetical protein Tco_0433321 [Tanacetum coccineum]